MSELAHFPSVLRHLVLAVLMVGVLVKPVLAAECEIRDATLVTASTLQAAGPEAPEPPSDEDCCLLADCDSCCSYAAAMTWPFDMAPVMPTIASSMPSLSVDFEPIACPVPFRPPIAT